YYLWLRSNCGDAGLGAWKHISFTTACGTITHFPFKENFNYNTFPPDCWSLNITNEYGTWKHNPENGGYAEVLYGLNQDEWLITPPMSFVNVKDPKLSFKWLMSYDFSVGIYDNYDLNCLVTTDNGTTWTLLWNEEDFGEFENFQWNTTEIDLSNFINEENLAFAWQYVGNDGARAGLDNILIEATALIEANTFPKYEDFDIDNPHDVIATIQWNDAVSLVQVVDNQNGAYVLVDGLDYEVSNDSLIIKSEYLAANLTEDNQISELHIDFDLGSSYLIITSTKISVEQFTALEFKIYPNPNKGEFIVELQQDAEMFITNILGKVIMSKSLNNGANHINISDQASGTYFINLIDENSVKTFRIIIE
ncbi:MAG: T9SS type A sorting domain-containing protein, partial [Bacteroidales bacterium]|nr:T9SS type A sorting domain-containing protein [Bacteroidales bacterium]